MAEVLASLKKIGGNGDNTINISYIQTRSWTSGTMALGGVFLSLDGRTTVEVGSRDSGTSAVKCRFYDASDTLLTDYDIPTTGGTYTAPSTATRVYLYITVNSGNQSKYMRDIKIY